MQRKQPARRHQANNIASRNATSSCSSMAEGFVQTNMQAKYARR